MQDWHCGFGLVIFDCDGVLVDSERLTVAVEARVLTELGHPHTVEEVVARFMGRSSEAQLAELEAVLGAESTRHFDEATTREVRAAFDRELVEIDGVGDVLDLLVRAEVPFCVASSGTHERIRTTLGITRLLEHFADRIFSAEDVTHGKPAPDLFLHAAAATGFPAEACAVVEDSVYGVRAGVAAGMTVFGYAGGLTEEPLLAEAGAVTFTDMAQLPGLLSG